MGHHLRTSFITCNNPWCCLLVEFPWHGSSDVVPSHTWCMLEVIPICGM